MTNYKIIFEAFRLGGIAEVAGPKSNPELLRIMQRHLPSATDDSTTAWCGILMGEIFDRAGLTKPKGHVAARSWLNVGEKVDIEAAMPGDILIFSRPPSAWQGHVGLYVWHTPSYIMVYGGNQSNKAGFQLYNRDRLLGVRRV